MWIAEAGVYTARCAFLTVAALSGYHYYKKKDSYIEGPAQLHQAQDYIPIVFIAFAAICLLYNYFFRQSLTAFHVLTKQKSDYYKEARTTSNNSESTKLLKNSLSQQRNQRQQTTQTQSSKPSLTEAKYNKVLHSKEEREKLCADRSAGNLLEQLIPFLVALFSYATFVNLHEAVIFGWMWVFFRSYYGIVFMKPFPALFLSTLPAYVCVWYMIEKCVYVHTVDLFSE